VNAGRSSRSTLPEQPTTVQAITITNDHLIDAPPRPNIKVTGRGGTVIITYQSPAAAAVRCTAGFGGGSWD